MKFWLIPISITSFLASWLWQWKSGVDVVVVWLSAAAPVLFLKTCLYKKKHMTQLSWEGTISGYVGGAELHDPTPEIPNTKKTSRLRGKVNKRERMCVCIGWEDNQPSLRQNSPPGSMALSLMTSVGLKSAELDWGLECWFYFCSSVFSLPILLHKIPGWDKARKYTIKTQMKQLWS